MNINIQKKNNEPKIKIHRNINKRNKNITDVIN